MFPQNTQNMKVRRKTLLISFLILCCILVTTSFMSSFLSFYLVSDYEMSYYRTRQSHPSDSYTRIALEDGIPGHPQTNTVIYVVNAFYDRRVLWDNAENITIRVFLLSSSVNVMNMTSLPRMACVSGDKVSNAWLKNLGKMSEFVYRKRNYDQYALSCSIKDTQNPFFQILIGNRLSGLIRAEEVEVDVIKQPLGYCGSNWYHIPGQETNSVINLIDWFEYHRYLGVSKFHLRVATGDDGGAFPPDKMTLLKYYEEIGVAEIRPMFDVPLEQHQKRVSNSDSEGDVWSASQSLQLQALNDCLYRNMFRYERIAVMDTDEFMVPESIKRNSLIQLMRQNSFPEYASLMFLERRFILNCHKYTSNGDQKLFMETKDESENMLVTKYHLYNKKYKVLGRDKNWRVGNGKSLIQPSRCSKAMAHHCDDILVGAQRDKLKLPLPDNAVHHYRQVDGVRSKGKAEVRLMQHHCKEVANTSYQWSAPPGDADSLREISQKIDFIYNALKIRIKL